MPPITCRFPSPTTLLLAAAVAAALASAPALAWDNSAMIAQQQRDAARMASERAMQDMLNAQRQADMLQANRLSQMRQDNRLNDLRQEELRKSDARVYGLDKPVTMPTTAAAPTPPAPDARPPAAGADAAGSRAAAPPVFPAQSVWADFPSQRVVAFAPDGTFKLFFPKDGQIFRAAGRYEVDGQRLRLSTSQSVETVGWALGKVVAQNGRPLAQLHLSTAQETTPWVACPACPSW